MKKQPKKLAITTSTIRALSDDQLAAANGGTLVPTGLCPQLSLQKGCMVISAK